MPLYFLIFIFGLTIGSFLNSVIYRLNKGENFISGRSYCPNCKHTLSWQDLVPLFSFLALSGKCRYCKKPISWQYPLVEISTALIFLAISNYQFPLLRQGFGGQLISNELLIPNFLNLFYLLTVACLLIVIFVYDLKYYIIPDGAVYSAIIIALIFSFQFLIFNQFSIFKFSILSALGAAGFFLLIFLLSKGKWMGFGDVKLALFMGLFLGFPDILVALFLAFLIGAIIGIGLIVFRQKKMSSEVPFGPFLILGTFLAMFFGEKLINWYINLISI